MDLPISHPHFLFVCFQLDTTPNSSNLLAPAFIMVRQKDQGKLHLFQFFLARCILGVASFLLASPNAFFNLLFPFSYLILQVQTIVIDCREGSSRGLGPVASFLHSHRQSSPFVGGTRVGARRTSGSFRISKRVSNGARARALSKSVTTYVHCCYSPGRLSLRRRSTSTKHRRSTLQLHLRSTS